MKNRTFILLFLCSFLSGCGQYGPLYLPNSHPEKQHVQHGALP